MSQNGQDRSPQYEDTTSDSSAVSEEGKWVGVGLGACVLVIFLAWIVRTCTKPKRRQRVLRKVLFCYDKQHWSDMEAPPPNSSSNQNGGTKTTTSRSENGVSSGTVVANGRRVPRNSYESTNTSGFNLKDGLQREDEMSDDEDEDDDDDDDCYDDDCYDDDDCKEMRRAWKDRNGNGNSTTQNGIFPKRHSRCSLHSLSITLETIEEDLNEPRHNSEPEIRIENEMNNINFNNNNNNNINNRNILTTHRSLSVPAKLSGMINNILLEEVPKETVDEEFESSSVLDVKKSECECDQNEINNGNVILSATKQNVSNMKIEQSETNNVIKTNL